MIENNKPLDALEELNFLVNISFRALKNKPKIIVKTVEIDHSDLIREDFILPAIVAMTNILGKTLLDGPKGQKAFSSILPFDVYKSDDSLCFLKLKEVASSPASKTLKLLLLMQVQKEIFIDPKNKQTNTVDLTNFVNSWRSSLINFPEGRLITPDKIAINLIQQNMKAISSTITNTLKSNNS